MVRVANVGTEIVALQALVTFASAVWYASAEDMGMANIVAKLDTKQSLHTTDDAMVVAVAAALVLMGIWFAGSIPSRSRITALHCCPALS